MITLTASAGGILMPAREIVLPKQREMRVAELTKRRWHRLPKFQRGMLHPVGFWFEPAGGTVPSATNVTMTHNTPVGSGTAWTAIAFKENANTSNNDARDLVGQSGFNSTDGWLVLGTDDNSVDHTGEWTTDTITESDWEVAWTTTNSGAFTTTYASIGTYTAMNTVDMVWRCDRVTAGKGRTTGTNSVNATFRIREVADTGNFDDFNAILTATQN